MRRDIPELADVPLSPTQIPHLKPRAEYGTRPRVAFFNVLPVLLIEFYQYRTVNTPHRCLMYPSCSEYARIAYLRYGFWAASFMTAERLRACNCFSDWPQRNKP